MPQMAPIWWTTLFTTFLIAFLMTGMLMYFLQTKKSGSMKTINVEGSGYNLKW
uniref:ATP synthase complex subunit 8 n=1 Tax=Phymata americana TaxID=1347736 RepID=A0A342CF63_9HEMI|nr:ATP synthase F0 subunit 8 [Phymata americana]AGO27990.1 ATP synthase F0 subunit 8 [Phymata americana]